MLDEKPIFMHFHETLNRINHLLFLMSIDLDLLDHLMKTHEQNALRFVLYLSDLSYDLEDVLIKNSPTPVNSPTTRGGVYFSDKFVYKVRGIIRDLSVVPFLSKTMLGPNTDFGDIKISTQLELDGKMQNLSMFTNLVNSVQSSSQIELHMILVKLETS